MQGTVVKISVEVGQEVSAGDTIVVLEAMKMENSILAERSGTVKEIKVKPGDTVGTGDVVAVIA
jgi:acetyl-CoA/propionyl-CoA carboxylase biotin carboxyl carrier protein